MIDKNKALRTGELLRLVIRATGFRNYFDENGWSQDLDDVANGKTSRSTHHELTEFLARKYLDEIEKQCCPIWATTIEREWEMISGYITSSSKRIHKRIVPLDENDITPLDFVIYELMPERIKAVCESSMGHLKLDTWWRSPFKAWLDVVSAVTNISEQTLTSRIVEYLSTDLDKQKGTSVSPKTIKNWKSGKPITKIRWPHQRLVEHVTRLTHDDKRNSSKIRNLTGLLIVAIAFQNTNKSIRKKMANSTLSERKEEQSQKHKDAEKIYDELQVRKDTIHQLFYKNRFSPTDVENELHTLQKFLKSCPENMDFIYDFYSARLAAFHGLEKTAIELYRKAQEGSAWVAGSDQNGILEEALVYSYGIRHKPTIKRYWDYHFLHGIIHGEKREMSVKDQQNNSEAFHKTFPFQVDKLVSEGDIDAIATELRIGIKLTESLFYETPFSASDAKFALDWLKNFLNKYAEEFGFHHDFYSARYAAFSGSQILALDTYRSVVEKSALIGGEIYEDILYESFVYSTGINELASSNRYWQEYYELKYNDGSPELSEDDRRQILAAFRNKFPTLAE